MRLRAWVGAALAASVVLVACGPEEEPERTGADPSGASAAVAAQLAPRVWLAEGESFRPMDATRFVERSALKFDHNNACSEGPLADPADPRRLGGKAAEGSVYSHQKARKSNPPSRAQPRPSPCERLHEGETHKSTEIGAGFYLDPPKEIRGGEEPSQVPVYWEHHRHGTDPKRTAYVYWFFYAYNRVVPGNWHESDWERVAVQLRDGKPEAVTFAGHGKPTCSVEWSKLDPGEGHPTVYSARGSHASYPTADRRGVDVTSKGTEWKTWTTLRPADREPWWGYGGWWGTQVHVKNFNGPMGPHPERKLPGIFTDTPCKGSTDEPPAAPSKEQPAPKTKEAAIGRYEQYLHAIGRDDVDTLCEIGGPAAKQAEDDGFGPCTVTIPIMLKMYSAEQKAALRKATVDPQRVLETAPSVYEIPNAAVRTSITFSETALPSSTMEYLKDNWYLTD